MTQWLPWILLALAVILACAIAAEAYLKRNRRKPLSGYRPTPPAIELGTEATDTAAIRKLHAENQRTEHRNRAHSHR